MLAKQRMLARSSRIAQQASAPIRLYSEGGQRPITADVETRQVDQPSSDVALSTRRTHESLFSNSVAASDNSVASSSKSGNEAKESADTSSGFLSRLRGTRGSEGSERTSEQNQDGAQQLSRDMADEAETSTAGRLRLADRSGLGRPRPDSLPSSKHASRASKSPSILSMLDPGASWLPPTSVVRPGIRAAKKSRSSRLNATPDETENFNRILDNIFQELYRDTGIRIGSSKQDPWSNASMYSTRPRNAASGGFGSNKYQPYAVGLPPHMRTSRPFERAVDEDDEEALLERDAMQEEASIIQTDVELVEWAKKRVFTPKIAEDGTVSFSPAYSRILAYLMRVIRTHYSNPHLALAMFHHAQHLSLESYLNGCLAPAYNELIKIRWESFRDLEGVELAVLEMENNAIAWDQVTHKTIFNIVDEVGKELIKGRGEDVWGSEIYERVYRLEARVQRDIHKEEMRFKAKQRETRAMMDRQRWGGPEQERFDSA